MFTSLAAQWPQHGLFAPPNPQFGCVVEGVAELRIAPNQAMIAPQNREKHKFAAQLLRLPACTFFAFPAGLPVSDGSRAHWESERPERAFARIVWMSLLPEGVMIHFCTTRGESHQSHQRFFLMESRASRIGELLLDELQSAHGATELSEIGWLHLHAFFLKVQAALQSNRISALRRETEYSVPDRFHTSQATSSDAIIVERACRYIEDHLTQPLRASQIAAQVYVSPSQLNALFRRELQSSPMKWVSQRRIEVARSLLSTTELSVQDIARHLSFRHASQFSNFFTRNVGVSPVRYRISNRATTKSNRNR